MNSGNVFAGTELPTTNKNGSLTRILIGAKSRSVSYGSFTFVTGEIVCEEATTSNVYPSGADFATASVPMIPLAPVRVVAATRRAVRQPLYPAQSGLVDASCANLQRSAGARFRSAFPRPPTARNGRSK